MTDEERARLWDAINDYAVACGGTPGAYVYGNARRQQAVADVEEALRGGIFVARADERGRCARQCDEVASRFKAAADEEYEPCGEALLNGEFGAATCAESIRALSDGGNDA